MYVFVTKILFRYAKTKNIIIMLIQYSFINSELNFFRNKSTDQTCRIADHRRSLHRNIFGFIFSHEKRDFCVDREKDSTDTAVGQRRGKSVSFRVSSKFK